MAYTTSCGYHHDVFISYAHADNFTLFGSVQWVSDFVADLEALLAKKLGTTEKPDVWIDHELAKNIPLDTALTDEIKNAATYLVIMSPAYLESAWCKKERQQFFNILKQRGSTTRVFLVEIDKLEKENYPMEIDENLVPYKFWTQDKDALPRTLGIPDRNTEDYYKCLLDIVIDMAKELKKIKNISVDKPAAVKESKGNVFLAQVTDDLDERREEVKRYLKDEGYRILPEENWYPSYESAELKPRIEQGLNDCSLYVQLLSSLQGKKLSGSDERITKFQFDIAKATGKKLMVWRSPDLKTEEISDAGMRALLESEYIRAEDLEGFKSALKTALLPQLESPLIDTHSDNPRFVYICTDARDRDYCDAVIKNEIKKAGLGYSFPYKSKELSVTKKFQKQNFIDCYATLFVYCQTEPDAVLSQILECYKIKALRKQPFRAIAIYDGPPKANDEGIIEIELPSFEIANLNCRENNYEFTENFIKKLCHD